MPIPQEFRETIEQACNRLEEAWRAVRNDSPPPILADFLCDESDQVYPYLVKELVRLDIEYGFQFHRAPSKDDYLRLAALDNVWLDDEFARWEKHEGTAAYKPPPSDSPPARTPASSPSSTQGRFAPGDPLNGRYRIIAFVGKGGMGEVYRADDLKLRQEVALKFLPAELANEPVRLQRFQDEVRITRQISHPNVCRVYDIGEFAGESFLTMEYIDGKDLAADLKRYGRLTQDRCIELARQLCAGLEAAHELGIVHRDLKPHNLLIDERGKLRITDFGLAAFADAIPEQDRRAGTPAYQAPEQVRGDEVTARTDLYALGVVLYQLITGHHPCPAKEIAEIKRWHLEEKAPPPSSLVPEEIRPAIDELILQCLEKEPSKRPASAGSLERELDPMNLDRREGKTPSPDAVKESGEKGTLSLAAGTALFASILALLVLLPFVSQVFEPYDLSQLSENPPDVLVKAAKEIIRELGGDQSLTARPHFAFGFLAPIGKMDDGKLFIDPMRPKSLEFWYRESPRSMKPQMPDLWDNTSSWRISPTNPSPIDPGMATLRITPKGRLLELLIIPTKNSQPQPESAVLEKVFGIAGLNFSEFVPIQRPDSLAFNSLPFLDRTLRYWQNKDRSCHVVTATNDGELVYFCAIESPTAQPLIGPVENWGKPAQFRPDYSTPESIALLLLIVVMISPPLAFYNLRLGRSDRQGAFRFSVYYFTIEMLSWIVAVRHGIDMHREIPLTLNYVMRSIAYTFPVWLNYIALEPFVRQIWPDSLISWKRLLSAKFRDPLIGRDFLIGGLVGLTMAVLFAPLVFKMRALQPDVAMGNRFLTALLLDMQQLALGAGTIFLLLLVLFRKLLRNHWLASVVFTVCILGVGGFASRSVADWGVLAFLIATEVILLTRYGLVALISFFFMFYVAMCLPLTTDVAAWYAGSGLFGLGVLGAMAAFAFYTSTLSGQSLFTELAAARK